MLEPILPVTIKSELINYVFFNKLKDTSISSLIVLLSFTIFLATFIVKFLIMKMLIIVMDEGGTKTETGIISSQQRAIYMNIAKLQNTNLVITTLIANSLSYSAITIILLIRSLYSGR
jgi:hypothetical protein